MDKNIASYIDHTYLKPDTNLETVKRIIQEAEKHQFASVCIPPLFMRDARRIIGEHNPIKLSTVVGFPLGYAAISSKSEEIKRAVDEGADEIDAVVNLAAFKSGQKNNVFNDIGSMIRATHLKGRTVKIILESNLLTLEELLSLAQMAAEMGAQFIKTGTGFFGATKVETVRFLKQNLPNTIEIKASGGIRTKEDVMAMVNAGASRVGTSAAIEIMASL